MKEIKTHAMGNKELQRTTAKAHCWLTAYVCIICMLLPGAIQADTNELLVGYSPKYPDQPCDEIVQKAEPDLLQASAQLELQITAPGEVLLESPQGFWLAPSIWNGELYGPSMQNANWHFTQCKLPGLIFGRSTA